MTESPDKKSADQSESWKDEAYRSQIIPDELPPDFQARNEASATTAPPRVSVRTKFALGLLGVAITAGITGDALLRATPWGLNVLVWVTTLTVSAGLLIQWRWPQILGHGRWLVAPLIFFAGALAWRDSATLNALALIGVLVTLMLIAFRAGTGRMLMAMVIEYLQAFLVALSYTMFGLLRLVFEDIEWRELPREGWANRARAGMRGLMIAAPLLLLFGSLLAAADAVFERIIGRAFNFDFSSLTAHLLIAGFITWIVGGFLRWMLMTRDPTIIIGQRPKFMTLGIIEIGTVLSLLNILFLTFVVVQFRYLFGGEANIPRGSGLAYAEYARAGFFELVWVSALVLPLLLVLHWMLRKEEPRHERIFRLLAGMQLALLGVIMISAVQRMRMYQRALGMTELRFYTVAFMGWLAIVFVWFALTVLRGRRERFAFGAVVSGLAMIAALHLISPDYWIARVNLRRAVEGKPTDLYYTSSLSADSLPALLEAMPALNDEARTIVRNQMRAKWQGISNDWRTWNRSRERAKEVAIQAMAIFEGPADISWEYRGHWRPGFTIGLLKETLWKREKDVCRPASSSDSFYLTVKAMQYSNSSSVLQSDPASDSWLSIH
jgi:hypothetical protein